MIRVATLVAMLTWVVLVDARPAAAGSCGGSSGDASGSSGNADSGSHSSGGDANDGALAMLDAPAEPACVETSDVLGRRQCGHFGEWAMPRILPPVAVEVGSSVRSFALTGLHFAGRIDHGADGSYAYRMTGGGTSDAAAVGADLRIVAGRRWYAGAEASIGGIAADETAMEAVTVEAMDGVTFAPTMQLHVAGGVVAGVRMPVGRLTVSGELFAGGRMIQAEIASAYGYCETVVHARDHAVVVEPRARVDLWVSPWMTVGAFAGADLATADARVFGLYLGGHARAFDGTH